MIHLLAIFLGVILTAISALATVGGVLVYATDGGREHAETTAAFGVIALVIGFLTYYAA